ncbi:MAG: hypothetical protein H6606_10865 [Flavobacteriales bacterium]|nr:hypothetical protein [Flavobacteriales bacterium]
MGFIFLMVEVLVTPGIIVGAIGLLFMGFGVYKTYEAYGDTAGNAVLVGSFLGSIFFVIAALKSGAWKRMASKDTIAGKAVDVVTEKVQVGDHGKSLSALRPTGNAFINGVRMEVQTEGEPVEANSPIEVIKIRQNKVFVKKVTSV